MYSKGEEALENSGGSLTSDFVFLLICNDIGEGEEEISVVILGQLINLGFSLCSDFIVVAHVEGSVNDVLDLMHYTIMI